MNETYDSIVEEMDRDKQADLQAYPQVKEVYDAMIASARATGQPDSVVHLGSSKTPGHVGEIMIGDNFERGGVSIGFRIATKEWFLREIWDGSDRLCTHGLNTACHVAGEFYQNI